jgi:hypothetical protein
MTKPYQKREITWVGKGEEPKMPSPTAATPPKTTAQLPQSQARLHWA